jgi:hypothetical protein
MPLPLWCALPSCTCLPLSLSLFFFFTVAPSNLQAAAAPLVPEPPLRCPPCFARPSALATLDRSISQSQRLRRQRCPCLLVLAPSAAALPLPRLARTCFHSAPRVVAQGHAEPRGAPWLRSVVPCQAHHHRSASPGPRVAPRCARAAWTRRRRPTHRVRCWSSLQRWCPPLPVWPSPRPARANRSVDHGGRGCAAVRLRGRVSMSVCAVAASPTVAPARGLRRVVCAASPLRPVTTPLGLLVVVNERAAGFRRRLVLPLLRALCLRLKKQGEEGICPSKGIIQGCLCKILDSLK